MRNLPLSLALTLFAVVSHAALAGAPEPPLTREPAKQSLFKAQFPELLRKFDVSPISKARAAECTGEGEICASDEQCCPGLQCVGGPPTTCSIEE